MLKFEERDRNTKIIINLDLFHIKSEFSVEKLALFW